MRMNWLLAFIPLAFVLQRLQAEPIIVFGAAGIAIVPLAKIMEQATDTLADYLGPTYGGLLSATMGNAPELIIGISALNNGLIEVLKGSIVGSILGTLLFGLGITMIAGGIQKPIQTFDGHMVKMNSSLLLLATFGLIIPAVFQFSAKAEAEISLRISTLLLLVYLASLVFTLKLKREATVLGPGDGHVIAETTSKTSDGQPRWSRNRALITLIGVASLLAIVSDLLTDSILPAADAMGLTPVFAGIFLLALVGNIPQYMNSVAFASRNRMTLALSINLGSTTQLVLLVAPLLVILGQFAGHPMNLLFSQFELVGIILCVTITRHLISDNSSSWLEGIFLVAVYLMLGVGFYYQP